MCPVIHIKENTGLIFPLDTAQKFYIVCNIPVDFKDIFTFHFLSKWVFMSSQNSLFISFIAVFSMYNQKFGLKYYIF